MELESSLFVCIFALSTFRGFWEGGLLVTFVFWVNIGFFLLLYFFLSIHFFLLSYQSFLCFS